MYYAVSRVVITRRDSGKNAFNFSGIVGMGIGLSNACYPPKSVSAGEMESRVVTSLVSSALGNLRQQSIYGRFSTDDEVWVAVAG
jgi:hypothetical protein